MVHYPPILTLFRRASGCSGATASQTGRDGSIAIRQDADLWLAKLKAGDSVTHHLAAGRHAWIHVAEGGVTINGTTLSAGDAGIVEESVSLHVTASKPSQVLLFDLS
jgi:redox-sensitive bicupin YhaK (pirin superfamily)